MNHLLHPELFETIPITGQFAANRLNSHLSQIGDAANLSSPENVTVVIRTLNEGNRLENLLEDVLYRQDFEGGVEPIVVDNESTDRTREVAKYFGAEIVTLARDNFTYPRSMNLGMEAASHNTVFVTVGHAQLCSSKSLSGGARHFRDPEVGGAFARALPNDNASRTEQIVSIGNYLFLKEAKQIKKAGMGVLAATGAMISKEAWEALGKFDERYEIGGEDTALAERMISSGWKVIEEPALSVHHSHALGPINYIRQVKRWSQSLKGPTPLDMNRLRKSRPDLDFSQDTN